MSDLTKLTAEELLTRFQDRIIVSLRNPEWHEIRRRVEQSDEWRAKYEETFAFYEDLRKQHGMMQERLEILEPLYAASESLRQQMNEQAAKDLTVFNQVRERMEKYEALNKYAHHRLNCRWLITAGNASCDCGYDAARTALEGK